MSFDLSVLRERKARTKKEVFRLEWLPTYSVDEDLEEFERWRRGEPTAADDDDNDYYVGLRQLRDRGVTQLRVRIVDFPIAEYLKYEIEFYRGSLRNGETLLFLERAIAVDVMQQTIVEGDFWLFDRSDVLAFDYENGDLVDQHWAPRDAVGRYCELRDALVERALPMEDFIGKFADSFCAPAPDS